MSYFSTSRNIELSIIYYLETQINDNWTGITVTKGFTQAYEKTLPVVCVSLYNTMPERQEVGSDTLVKDYGITVDVFATSDGQRIDLADFIVDKLKDGCVFYIHSHATGDPSTLARTADGRIRVLAFDGDRKIEFSGGSTETFDKFRHKITISVRNS